MNQNSSQFLIYCESFCSSDFLYMLCHWKWSCWLWKRKGKDPTLIAPQSVHCSCSSALQHRQSGHAAYRM